MWARQQIGPQDIKSIVRDARDYALTHGLVLRYPSMTNDNCVGHIPITLFPSPIPRRLYQECLDIQPTVSRLMLNIANDGHFIEDSLKTVVQADEFTKNLLNINKIVQKEGLAQPIVSCIDRSDYMLDKHSAIDDRESLKIRQVEVNAIASGMSSHSYNTSLMHKYLMAKYRIELPAGVDSCDNGGLETVAQGMIDAFDAYGRQDSFILLVAEERSLNFSDHVLIEFMAHKLRPDIRVVRRRFIDLQGTIKLGPNKELLVDGVKEIALVYFRYCYDPSQYGSSAAWDTRLLMERSRAIKCPSINFHLSGAKKFQQVLNSQKQLERFLSPNDAKKLTQVFCRIWSLDAKSTEGEEGYKMGLNSSGNFVLKPQREGGGHNIFGSDIKPFLEQIVNSEDRSQYILMEYINGPCEKNWILKHDDQSGSDEYRLDSNDKLVSELGVYGAILAENNSIISNRAAGYLVRSKNLGVNEGGVASGFAAISSLVLIDDQSDDFDLSLFYDS